jgi:MFS superfamily sulfate permease-like transporter
MVHVPSLDLSRASQTPLFVGLFLCLFVWLFVCFFVWLVGCLFVCVVCRLFVCLFVSLIVGLFVCLCVCVFVCVFSSARRQRFQRSQEPTNVFPNPKSDPEQP